MHLRRSTYPRVQPRRVARWAAWFALALAARSAAALEAPPPRPVDFETQVVPVLTRAGCNTGACHGAAIGRGGLRLSLFGGDPQADYDSLVNEFQGRRVHRLRPDRSLLLRKPSLDLEHGGGLRFTAGGDAYEVIEAWIAAGVPRGPARRLERLEVAPAAQWLSEPGRSFAITVRAHMADAEGPGANGSPPGRSIEDVTRWAVFLPQDPAMVDVSARGEVTPRRAGEHLVLVRFLGELATVRVTVPIGAAGEAPGRASSHFVDDWIHRKLDELRVPHSPRADDAALARRIYLDLLGTLSSPAEADEFVAELAGSERRAEAVARIARRLMDRPEFAQHWAYKWGDWLRIESRRLQPEGAAQFHAWVKRCMEENTRLDAMGRDMLMAAGDAHVVGPANFSRVPNDARAHAEFVSRLFLGVRLQCANCHNHPLDRWTQDDYHGMAALFARIDRGREVRALPRGDVIHPKTGSPATPRIPGNPEPVRHDDLRAPLADWLFHSDNPYFPRTAVNRIWSELMGRGLVEPVDDHRATNPATHPELLDALARDFTEHRFDMRHTIERIVTSEAYQRSSRPVPGNESDDRFYSKASLRPLPPQVLVDAVATVTGVPERFGDLPAGTRAISLGDSRVASRPLDLLGRCDRGMECSGDSSEGGSLPLALHALNGPWLNAKIADPSGRLAALLQSHDAAEPIVRELYRVALSREPRRDELDHWGSRLSESADRAAAYHDFVWAMLNSVEFACNH